MEKEIKKLNNLIGKTDVPSERSKAVRVGNVIEFQTERKAVSKDANSLASPKGSIIKGLGRPSAKINFLNDQLGNAKSELVLFRQNHNALVEQIVFVQKDFRRRLRAASAEKKASEDQLKKVTLSYKIKEKELLTNDRRLQELKTKLNDLHAAYSDKLGKFKEQHKVRVEEREGAVNKKYRAVALDKQRLEKSVSYLMDIVHQKTDKISSTESSIQILKKESLNLVKENEGLATFKRETTFVLESAHKELSFIKNDFDSLSKDYKEKEEEVEALKFRINSLRGDVTISDEKREEMQKKLVRLRSELESKNYRMSAYEQTIEDLRQNSIDANKLSNDFSNSQYAFEAKVKVLEDQRDSLEKREIEIQEALKQLKGSVIDKDVIIADQRSENIDLKRDLKEEFSAGKRMSSKLMQSEKAEQEQARTIISYKKNTAELRAILESRNNKIDSLNGDLEKIENQKEELAAEYTTLEEHASEVSQEIRLASEQNRTSLGNISDLNEKSIGLSTEIFDLKEEKEALNGRIKDLQSEIKSEQVKFEGLDSDMRATLEDLEASKRKESNLLEAREEWEETKESLELRIKDFSKDLNEREDEVSVKQEEIEKSIDTHRILSSDLEKVQAEKNAVEQLNMALDKEKDQLVARVESGAFLKERLDIDFKESTEKNAKLTDQVVEFEKSNMALERQLEDLERKIAQAGVSSKTEESSLNGEIDLERAQKQALQDENTGFQSEITTLKASIEGLRSDLNESNKSATEYQAQIENLEFGAKNVEASVDIQDDLDEKVQKFAEKETDFEAEMEKRRGELNLYSRWVDSQKESLKEHIVRFSQELKLSASVNPINSYLAMTKKELSKVRLLLSKPGVVGVQRTYLEEHCELLVEQQRFVEELVVTTKADTEKRAGEVIGLLKQSEFIPVPPLPPKKK